MAVGAVLFNKYGLAIGLIRNPRYSPSSNDQFLWKRCRMASPLDVMLRQPGIANMSTTKTTQTERRSSRRCKITQLMRLRPSDPEKDHFEDIRGSLSVSRSGVFFQSSEPGYEVGMRLFVTMPYSKEPAAVQREFLAEVVRRDLLPNGLFGVGFKILMEVGFQTSYSFGNYSQRK